MANARLTVFGPLFDAHVVHDGEFSAVQHFWPGKAVDSDSFLASRLNGLAEGPTGFDLPIQADRSEQRAQKELKKNKSYKTKTIGRDIMAPKQINKYKSKNAQKDNDFRGASIKCLTENFKRVHDSIKPLV